MADTFWGSLSLTTALTKTGSGKHAFVYAGAFEPLVQTLDEFEVDFEEIGHGLSFGRDDLDDRKLKVSWDEFCTFCERFEIEMEPYGGVEVVGDVMLRTGYARILGSVVGLMANPRWFYIAAHRWFGSSMIPVGRSEYEEDGDIQRITINLPPDIRDCPQFFRITQSMFSHAPRLLGAGRAVVSLRENPHQGVLDIKAPPSATLFARMRRAFSAIFTGQAVLDELTEQHVRLLESLHSLESAHDKLESVNTKLQLQQERFSIAVEATGVGVFELDLTGRAVFLSDRTIEILNPGGATVDIRWWNLVAHPMDAPRVTAALERITRGKSERESLEVRISNAGAWRWMAMGIMRSESRIAGTLQDISNRVKRTQELARSEANFRALIEGSPQPLIVFDEAGLVLYANQAFVRELGIEMGELEGRNLTSLPEDPAEFDLDHLDIWVNTPREITLKRQGGSPGIFDAVAVDILFDGAPAYVMVARDVTEEKALQARLMEIDRMVAVGTLAAGVAHEINNPLAYVQSNVEYSKNQIDRLMADSPGLREQLKDLSEALADSLDGSQRVRDIVRDLQAFSHVETDEVCPVPLDEIAISSVNMAWHEIRQRARLETHFADMPPVTANPSRLGQVILNIIVNAAQAIDVGSPTENLIILRTYSEDGFGVVEVKDTGGGIEPEVLNRIFDPFFTTKPVGQGTGLGLSISHSTINRYGGTIEFESTIGEGTTCRVRLPLAQAGDIKPVALGEEISEVQESDQSILVIDDDVHIGTMMQRVLSTSYRVVYLQSGEQALQHLESMPDYSLILCDALMPGLSGLELFELIKETMPTYKGRFAMMTGGMTIPEGPGIPPLLRKPFGTSELREFLKDRFAALEMKATSEIDRKRIINVIGH